MILALILAFHPTDYSYTCIPLRSDRPSAGCYPLIKGKDRRIAQRLSYDDLSGIWTIQEGSPQSWLWTVLRDGDTISVDEKGISRVKFHED